MYTIINERKSVPDTYAEYLEELGVVTHEALKEDVAGYNLMLSEVYKKKDNVEPKPVFLKGIWSEMIEASDKTITSWDTGKA
jgi:2-oxoglutarate dehydrogenase complex dehydrogenase (E1) component-like enzyme